MDNGQSIVYGQPVISGNSRPFASDATPVVPNKNNSSHSKRKFIAIVSVIAFIATLVLLLVTLKLNSHSSEELNREEVYSLLLDFYNGTYSEVENPINDSYHDLFDKYDSSVGASPSLIYTDYSLMFPVTNYWLNSFGNELDAVETAFESISKADMSKLPKEEQASISATKASISTDLSAIRANYTILRNFYDAFVEPVLQLYQDNASVTCSQSEEMLALMNNAVTSAAAEKYYNVYCEAIAIHHKTNDAQTLVKDISSLASEATATLNEALSSVAGESISKTEQLLKDLAQ